MFNVNSAKEKRHARTDLNEEIRAVKEKYQGKRAIDRLKIILKKTDFEAIHAEKIKEELVNTIQNLIEENRRLHALITF